MSVTIRVAPWALMALLCAVVFAMAHLPAPLAYLEMFTPYFLSILLEALPFLLLGTVVSAFIDVFVSPDLLLRFVPRGRVSQAPAGSILGLFFPVCECGIVPVVRRCVRKGMPAPMALAFLLAAPVVNPVVILSTAMAFGWGWMLAARYGVTLIIASVTALWVGNGEILNPMTTDGHSHKRASAQLSLRIRRAFVLAGDEFVEMGSYLAAGCLLASLLQTAFPREIITQLGTGVVSSVLSMQLLAFVLSICSTVDAFIALAFAGTFASGSLLAFLTFGPIIDIKSLLLFTRVFRANVVHAIVIVVFGLTLLAGSVVNLLNLPPF